MMESAPDGRPIFRAAALPARAAGRAYPLVHLANPALDLPTWIVRVQEQAALPPGTGGLTAFEDERGYIHAVFSWLLLPPAQPELTLRISDLVLAHWPGRALHEVVIGEIRSLAATVAAASVQVDARDKGAGLRPDFLMARGFSPLDESTWVVSCRPH